MKDSFDEDSGGNMYVDLLAIHTPGHTTDHVSFLLRHKGFKDVKAENVFISGDIILDCESTYVQNMTQYMNTLKILRETKEYAFDSVCVSHSDKLDLEDTSHVIMPGKKKLDEYY